MDPLGLPEPKRHRVRPALRWELPASGAMERGAAEKFLGTHEPSIAHDPPAPEPLLGDRELRPDRTADHGVGEW